jgi:S-adenosylmethionine:tRNA ribosyltransferase-isomerase
MYLSDHIDKSVTAVGTTSLRTLESLFWIGEKIAQQPNLMPHELLVDQWQPYVSSE